MSVSITDILDGVVIIGSQFSEPMRVVGSWRFGHLPMLKKVHADRKQALDPDDVKRNMCELVKTVFKRDAEIHLSMFQKDSTEIFDQTLLTLSVAHPQDTIEQGEVGDFRERMTEWTRKCGQSSRQNPGGVIWVVRESGSGLRPAVEELLAWQAVADDANRGLLGDLEPDDLRRIQRELNNAKGQIEDRVWGSYNHLFFWDAAAGCLKELPLGQLHPSEARSITSAILARLRHESLLSREIGSSYIERNWPPAFKESGAWPLASLKAAFFQGYFTRLEKADDALKTTIGRAVGQGFFGLASGKDPAKFDRTWLKEVVEPADITFDYDTYLLTAATAKALKQGAAQPPAQPPVQPPTPPLVQPPLPPGKQPPTPPAPPESTKVVWEGELKREQWNLFSLKVLTRLTQSDDLQIDVKVKATLKEGQTTEPLNTALKELAITGQFRKE